MYHPRRPSPKLIWSALFVCFLLCALFFSSQVISAFGETGSVVGKKLICPTEDEAEKPLRRLTNPDSEVRGIWIASVYNINYPSKKGLSAAKLKAELDDIVATAEACSLNTIYFQVRPSSDALYVSSLFPTSAYLTGKQGSPLPENFDPLAYLVREAHRHGIFVHAWINPLRVTVGTASSPSHDLSALAENHPARLHPEWTVAYADGQVYFDPGIPAVRDLVTAGVREIVENYNVDGVIFDDYFYPYPVSGAEFADSETYLSSGSSLPLADWRRENVNRFVEACYSAVKEVSSDCLFGVAPFGIWKNDDGTNGGSATHGLESFSAIYCDPLAWIEGGYLDYIAPQIYWYSGYAPADYSVLLDWWSDRLKNYPDVGLVITHAAYQAETWGIENEIMNQVNAAREKREYVGSSFYGYAAVKANEGKLREQFSILYRTERFFAGKFSD